MSVYKHGRSVVVIKKSDVSKSLSIGMLVVVLNVLINDESD